MGRCENARDEPANESAHLIHTSFLIQLGVLTRAVRAVSRRRFMAASSTPSKLSVCSAASSTSRHDARRIISLTERPREAAEAQLPRERRAESARIDLVTLVFRNGRILYDVQHRYGLHRSPRKAFMQDSLAPLSRLAAAWRTHEPAAYAARATPMTSHHPTEPVSDGVTTPSHKRVSRCVCHICHS